MPTVLRSYLFVDRIASRSALDITFDRLDLHEYVPSEEAGDVTHYTSGYPYLDPHSDQNILWFARAGVMHKVGSIAWGLELCPPSQALQREYRGVLKRCHCQCRGISQPAGSGNAEELKHEQCCKTSHDHYPLATRVRAHTTPSTSATARQHQYRLETRDIDHGDDDDEVAVPVVVPRGRRRQSVMRLLQTARDWQKRVREMLSADVDGLDTVLGLWLPCPGIDDFPVSIDDCPVVYAEPVMGEAGYAWRNAAEFLRYSEENQEGAVLAWLTSHGW